MFSKLDPLSSSKSSSFVVFHSPSTSPLNEDKRRIRNYNNSAWPQERGLGRAWSRLISFAESSFVCWKTLFRGSRPATKALETSISVNSSLKKYRLWSLKEIDFINLLNNYFTFFNPLHFNNTRLLCRQSFPVLEAFYLTLWLRVYVLRTLMSPSG